MKPAIRLFLAAAFALALALWIFGAWRKTNDQADYRVARERLKREMLERSAAARQLGAEQAKEWTAEIRALSRWYADEGQSLRNRHRAMVGKGAPVAAKEPDGTRAEWQQWAEDRARLLSEGKYAPLAVAVDRGLHMDLLSIAPGPNPAGGAASLRVDFAIWGVPRRTDREPVAGSGRFVVRTMVPMTFKQLSFQFIDAAGKPYGEMSGSGEPYQKLADPERFVEDFPPGVLFGTWYVDKFPREAARAVVTLPVETRGMAGGDATSTFKFDLPVEEAWRLAPGESYQAETREAPR
jgi:hypothetical protein